MISNTPCFQIALSIDEFCPQDKVIEKVGGDQGGVAESRATPTTATEDDKMSGGDVIAEIQQDGGTAGGGRLTAKVSKLLITRAEVVCLFVWSFALFVCCVS